MIGEIGMDFYWAKNVSKSAQEKVFRYILEHCHNHKKFCLIHTKGAEKEILEKKYSPDVVWAVAKKEGKFKEMVSTKTLYNYMAHEGEEYRPYS